MIEEWVWGGVPVGFVKLCPERDRRLVVREGLQRVLDGRRFFAEIDSAQAASPLAGRGRLREYRLGNGEAVLVRAYHHGGVLRPLTGQLFFTWPPRPFEELRITEVVRQRGVPTLELLGACVSRVWGPFYRGWLISRELRGGCDFWAALQSESYSGAARRHLLDAVARALRAMHGRGVYHSDLNLKNILIREEPSGIRSYLIDFDKARLFPGAVPPARAAKNLRRLFRSACKLDPERRRLARTDWDLFVRSYRDAGG